MIMSLPVALMLSPCALIGWASWTPDLQHGVPWSRYSGVNDSEVEVAGIRLMVRDQGRHDGRPVSVWHRTDFETRAGYRAGPPRLRQLALVPPRS